ncbi:MAG TPA: cupredoxin family copper-binding protein [Ferruginibacter sp.]|nr:cupredoxin family copper-binding protein [Ferruginibacter sp.]
MKTPKIFLFASLLAFSSIYISSCSKSSDAAVITNDPAAQIVNIQNMQYSPAEVTVTPGTTITWKNLDNVVHTVSADNYGSFNSGDIPPGGTFSMTFTDNGIYPYHCMYHTMMTGRVQVATR